MKAEFATAAPLSLEERYELLLRENRMLKSQIYTLERGPIKADDMHYWLVRKIERQRLAIQRLEWKGWQPELIIEEAA